ncbi:MAG TPA: hypothetical protein VFT06_14095 [Flavisolibacter sp.]|nr:hypothetical protein [Flavisolibacter sp.]
MKQLVTLSLFLLFTATAYTQNKQQLSLDLNRSFHGTGDMRGLGFAVEYGHYVGKRIELTAGVGTNVHHDVYPLFLNQSGRIVDASYRMVTGGLQLNGQVNVAPLRTRRHEVKLGIGPVVRYQSSSASGGYGVLSATGYPEPVFTFRQYEKQNVVTVGYLAALSYSFTFPGQFLIGAKASFQNDTNADVITQYGLRIGKRF